LTIRYVGISAHEPPGDIAYLCIQIYRCIQTHYYPIGSYGAVDYLLIERCTTRPLPLPSNGVLVGAPLGLSLQTHIAGVFRLVSCLVPIVHPIPIEVGMYICIPNVVLVLL